MIFQFVEIPSKDKQVEHLDLMRKFEEKLQTVHGKIGFEKLVSASTIFRLDLKFFIISDSKSAKR